eukprot:10195323-Alexandrium_andersonii.AAC.1
MSASLVGSEMCIRDSKPWVRGTSHARPAPATPTSRGFRGLPDALGPVSYTHLTLPTICSV